MAITSAIVDSREPPDVVKSLGSIGGVATTVAPLPAGDVLIVTEDGRMIAIERKAPLDLIGSIKDGRLPEQVCGMRAITPWCYVVITDAILPDRQGLCWADRQATQFRWAALQGALQSAQECGTVVVWTNGPADYLPTIERIASRPAGDVRLGALRGGVMIPAGELVLTAFPGVGEVAAKALLGYCGTAARAISYLSGDYAIDKVPGVGPATRQSARNALGLNDSECLHVVMREEPGETKREVAA